jgi:hypothetical protein
MSKIPLAGLRPAGKVTRDGPPTFICNRPSCRQLHIHANNPTKQGGTLLRHYHAEICSHPGIIIQRYADRTAVMPQIGGHAF